MDMTKFRPNIVVDDDDEDKDDDGDSNDINARAKTDGPDDGRVLGQQRLKPWEEDYWGELTISPPPPRPASPTQSAFAGGPEAKRQPRACRLELTANCGRCNSINVDYATGRTAAGEQGTALKKLMKDRRVDAGSKYTPIFGRYAFLLALGRDGGGGDGLLGGDDRPHDDDDDGGVSICVGDHVVVTRRKHERDVWSWPKYDD
ncbi:hypothetical protein Micbo1qcDRAFT_169386 [Microdochium bolleyi]|uniref:MOSC domain-containing protein n=1 Tax=Microdochium bolleyi TaxID=196109 RepID=A0A136IKU1_9PEZI|nr:hypothetical protein Micbo1qcDRAFT_169386 [Microdochium bolleyi]